MRFLPRSLTAGLIVPAKGKNWWAVPTLLTVRSNESNWSLEVITHCTPLECGAVGALCTIDMALFQSANIWQVVG